MSVNSTARRGAAIASGLVLASGGICLLFGDVLCGEAAFTQKHYLTLVIVTGTMLAFHVAYEAWCQKHFAPCLGFILIVAAGTGLIVYNSLGRQAEGYEMTSIQHDDQIRQRLKLEELLAIDQASIKERRAAADAECASGEGTRCRSARSTVAYYMDSAKGIEARLALLKPPKPVDSAAENFGNLAAAFGYDREQARALAILAVPYFITLFFEFGTTISLGYAFSPRWRRQLLLLPSMKELSAPDESMMVAPHVVADSVPGNPVDQGKPIDTAYSKSRALGDLLTRLALGETVPSQYSLAERWQVDKGTVSKWCREWEQLNLIPDRQQVGRFKVIAN